MSNQQVGFGVVGLGTWGENHLKTLADEPGVYVAGICDINEELLSRRAEEYDIPFITTDYEELVTHEDVQAVSVVTPDFLHYDIAMAAAQAGKHLLVEKPMATSLEEAHAIAAAVHQAGITLMVDFHNRWNPTIMEMKKAIDAGELGEVKMASLRLSNRIWVPTELLSWGGQTTVTWWLGSHISDLACWLLQDRAVRVYSVARRGVLEDMGLDTPDFFHSILEFAGGAVVHLDNCWILGDAMPAVIDFQVHLVGSEGTMYADCSHNLSSQKYTHDSSEWPNPLVMIDSHGTPRGFAIESIRHFAGCIREDSQPLVSVAEALHNMEILVAIHQSVDEGQPVEIE